MSGQIKANPTTEEQEITKEDQKEVLPQQEQQEQEQEHAQLQQDEHKPQKKTQKYLKPQFIFCSKNENMDELIKTYPHLQSLKDAEKINVDEIKQAESYVIRSNNDDDIHKAIKYAVWCSTPPNNEKLDKAFKEAQEQNKEIYLFYSVVKSGQFVGVAKLKSALKEETFGYWWQHAKWRGHFQIEWLFVKDILHQKFQDYKNEDDMSVVRSKDGTKIDWTATGQHMLRIYQEAPKDKTIFQDFSHMDQREQFQRFLRNQHPQQHQHQVQQQQQYPYYYNNQYQQYYGQQPYYYNYYQQQQQQQYGQYVKYYNAYPPQGNQSNYNRPHYQGNNQGQTGHYHKKQGGHYNHNYRKNGGQNNKYNNYNKNYHNNKPNNKPTHSSHHHQKPQQQQQQQQQEEQEEEQK